jgi:hypothetical protein
MLRKRAVAAAVIGAIVGSGLVAAEEPAGVANPDICPPTVSNPQPRPAALGPGEDLVVWFAKAAGNKIGGAAFAFVMSRLGLGDQTAAQLREISDQLTQINAKLDQLKVSVDDLARRVDEVAFTNLMARFKELRTNVNSISNEDMQEVALAAENLANVLASPGTPDQIAEARACLQQKKAAFRVEAGKKHAATNVENITNLLVSTATEDELVTGYGRLLLHRNTFLSRAHSQALRDFYDFLEQYQALAAIQKAEWQVAEGKAVETIRRSNAEFYNEAGTSGRPGWVQTQRAALPDLIPEGVLIDIGTAADTTVGKTMFFPLGGTNHGPKETTWRDPDLQSWFTGSAEAPRVAAEFSGPSPHVGDAAWKNWKIINAPQWVRLIAGKKDSELGSTYLNDRFGLTSRGPGLREPFGESSWVWINHRRNHDMTMKKGRRGTQTYKFPLTVRVRLDRSGPMANVERPPGEWAPVLQRNQAGMSKPQVARVVSQAYDAARASLILTRPADVNYMVLKSGQH